jgi:hypothetical protein
MYAIIRESINNNFKRYLTRELCQYREDLVDTSLTSTEDMTSKPEIVVQLLCKLLKQIIRRAQD